MEISRDDFEKLIEKVIDKYRKEESKDNKRKLDMRLHNTKLLLRNFKSLQKVANLRQQEIDESDDNLDIRELMMKEDLIESIKSSKKKTITMVGYCERMLKAYEMDGEMKYNILYDTYINKLTIDQLMEKYNYSKTRIYELRNEAIEEFSVCMFGVDGINFK